jgi:hypothetical protein
MIGRQAGLTMVLDGDQSLDELSDLRGFLNRKNEFGQIDYR